MFSWRKRDAGNRGPEPDPEPAERGDEPRVRDWTDDLSDEERDQVIEKVAQGVVRRGMETPAILFLEMHKPVSFFAGQSMVVLSPFTAPFVGLENIQIASKLIEKRENVERLIQRIEEMAAARDAERDARRKEAARNRAKKGTTDASCG